MMLQLSTEQVTDMVIAASEAIIEKKDFLTQVDSAIGDGDHGIGMAGGMQKAKIALEEQRPFASAKVVFKTAGMSMLHSMGGASGVIFGTFFLGGAKQMNDDESMDAASLRLFFRHSLDAIKERGKAQMGDKTMIDAFEPAVLAMESADTDDLIALMHLASEAATQGVEDSKKYIAKFGRAKSLMERAIGHADAGATSISILFAAMHSFLQSIA